MCIIEKVFTYEENEITVIKHEDEIWFRGKDVAKALKNHLKYIHKHI